MKTKPFILIFLVLLAFTMTLSGITDAAAPAVWQETRNVKLSGGTASVKIVWTGLNNNRTRIEVVPAGGKIGSTAPLKDQVIVSRRGESFAVNIILQFIFSKFVI